MLPSLDDKPSGNPFTKPKKEKEEPRELKRYPNLSKSKKLKMLDDLLLDSYINAMEEGNLKPLELGAVVTYLKNNKEVAEKKEHSESDLIEDLVDE